MLKSMTGFARCDGAQGPIGWHWEVRSVNGRGLDVRLRLPVGYEGLEQRVRDACKAAFTRGNCQISLAVQRELGAAQIRLNEAALAQVAAAVARAQQLVEAAPPQLDGLLAIRGVLEAAEAEPDETQRAALSEAMLKTLETALTQVNEMRAAEGARLATAIAGHIDEVAQLVDKIASSPARTPEAIRTRLQEQIKRLLDEAPRLDEQRLYQEAVLLAAKADVHEELDRLRAHVAAARELLEAHEPVGRQFEFLAQEFNREANTICSKSNDVEISRAGLAMKAIIDKLREQVQNIE